MNNKRIYISESLVLNHTIEIDADFICNGNVERIGNDIIISQSDTKEHRKMLSNIQDQLLDLYVDIIIYGDAYINGDLNVDNITVFGNLYVSGTVYAQKIVVTDTMCCTALNSEDIYIGGDFYSCFIISAENLHIAGSAEVTKNGISEQILSGIWSDYKNSLLEGFNFADKMCVYGNATIENLSALFVEVYGDLTTNKDSYIQKALYVYGKANVDIDVLPEDGLISI